MECDVIVTYCWNRVGYNIIRSLSSKGLSVVVGDNSKKNICSMSKFSSGSFVYADPFTKEEEFIDDLNRAIHEYKPKVLMPTHDEGLIIAKNIDKFPKNVLYAIEAYAKLMILSDKFEATRVAKKANVPTPELISDYKAWKQYPIVVKTKFGNSAKGVFFPKTVLEAEQTISNYNENDILIEEFFPGTDYSVDCLRWKGQFWGSCYKALVTKTEGGGTTTQRVIADQPNLIDYAKSILDELNYNGICGFDFKVNDNGEAVFIEANARFTGGLATPIAAGFDIPFVYYSCLTNGSYENDVHVKIGTKTKWILGDVIALVTKIMQRSLKKEEFKKISSFKYDAFDDFCKEDKKAIWGEMTYYLNKLIKNRKLNP